MDEQPTIVPVQRTGPAPLVRIGLVGAAAAALVAVGILAAAASAAPSGTLAANPGASSAASSATGTQGTHPGGGPGWEMGGRGGMRAGEITITAISGSSISLKTADGWTRTITVGTATTYQKAGATAALSDLKVGDEIQFRETRGTDGSYTIDAIAVIPPHTGGTVTAISGSTITVTLPDGTSGTIKVGSTTTFDVAGNASARLSDIKTGMLVNATGSRNSDGSLTATTVRAFDPATMPFGGHHGFGHGFPGDNDGGSGPIAPASPSGTSGTTGG